MQDAIGVFLVELSDERLLCGHPECGRMDWDCVLSTPVLMLIQAELDCSTVPTLSTERMNILR